MRNTICFETEDKMNQFFNLVYYYGAHVGGGIGDVGGSIGNGNPNKAYTLYSRDTGKVINVDYEYYKRQIFTIKVLDDANITFSFTKRILKYYFELIYYSLDCGKTWSSLPGLQYGDNITGNDLTTIITSNVKVKKNGTVQVRAYHKKPEDIIAKMISDNYISSDKVYFYFGTLSEAHADPQISINCDSHYCVYGNLNSLTCNDHTDFYKIDDNLYTNSEDTTDIKFVANMLSGLFATQTKLVSSLNLYNTAKTPGQSYLFEGCNNMTETTMRFKYQYLLSSNHEISCMNKRMFADCTSLKWLPPQLDIFTENITGDVSNINQFINSTTLEYFCMYGWWIRNTETEAFNLPNAKKIVWMFPSNGSSYVQPLTTSGWNSSSTNGTKFYVATHTGSNTWNTILHSDNFVEGNGKTVMDSLLSEIF